MFKTLSVIGRLRPPNVPSVLFPSRITITAENMLLTTIGFILACITSAFVAVMLAEGRPPDGVPVVLIPILIAAFPLLTARTLIARFTAGLSGLVLLAFSIIGGFSIGMFYFPAAVVILAAAVFRIRIHDQPERPAPDDDFWSQRSDKP